MAHVLPDSGPGTTTTVGGATIYSQPPSFHSAGQISVITPFHLLSQQQQQQQQQMDHHLSSLPPPKPAPAPPSFLLSNHSAQEQRRQVIPLEGSTTPAAATMVPTAATTANVVPAKAVSFAPATPEEQRGEATKRPASAVAAVAQAEASQWKAQVRVLEHEVRTLREGLAKTSQTVAPRVSPTRPPALRQPSAVGTGKPEIAFGRRVEPSTYYALPARRGATSTTTTRRRGASADAAAAKARAKTAPPGQEEVAEGGDAPRSSATAGSVVAHQQHQQQQPVLVPVWGGSREVPLQGSAAGATLMPDPTTTPSPAGEKSYWFSADPIHMANRRVAVAPPPSQAASATAAASSTTTVVQLSPSASADSGVPSLQQHQQQRQQQEVKEAPPPAAAAAAMSEQPPVQSDSLAGAQAEMAAQRELIATQEASLRAMALALVDMERKLAAASSTPQAASMPSSEGGEVAGRTQQREAALLTLAQQLAESQRREADEREKRAKLEAALQASVAEAEKQRRAVETLREENARLLSVTSSAPTSAPPPSAPAPDASQKQVEQLTRKLKAWERWYMSQQSTKDSATGPSKTPSPSKKRVEECSEEEGDGTLRCGQGCCLASPCRHHHLHHHPPYRSLYQDHHGDAMAGEATADPLAYLRSWRRYLPVGEERPCGPRMDTTTHQHTATAPLSRVEDDKAVKASAADGGSGKPMDGGNMAERPGEATGAGAAAYHYSPEVQGLLSRALAEENHELTAFLAKERALRELATAEREVAEERLRHRWALHDTAAQKEEKKAPAAASAGASAGDRESPSETPPLLRDTAEGSACTP